MGFHRLDDYPKLVQWYLSRRDAAPDAAEPVSFFLHSLCAALKENDANFSVKFAEALDYLAKSEDVSGLLNYIEQVLASACATLPELASEAAELGIQRGIGGTYFDLFRSLADRTENVTFRFLAAWVALNCERHRDCIDQCEAVDYPYAPIHSLHGQALLEIGDAAAAIEVLDVAVTLEPQEILAWFQLAKACHVLGQHSRALEAARVLRRIAPQNPEVGVMMAIIVLSAQQPSPSIIGEAWRGLAPFVKDIDNDCIGVGYLFDLALQSETEENMSWLIDNVRWNLTRKTKDFPKFLAKALRSLNPLHWPVSAQKFIEKVNGQETHPSTAQ